MRVELPSLRIDNNVPMDALELLTFEHQQQREMCDALEYLADTPVFDANLVFRLAELIRTQLTLHMSDEEELLFPLLRKRCAPGDDVGAALAQLNAEHETDMRLSAEVRVFLLDASEQAKPLSALPGAASALRAFAQSQRRHISLENNSLIPLARRVLTEDDCRRLAREIAARRNAL